jgi:branched-chain amino acid transport system permease protein
VTRALKALIVALGLLLVLPAAVATATATQDGGDEAEGETINVRLRDEATRADVGGVTVLVLRDGEVIREAETGDDGVASFSVPEPGEYEVEVDLETLPEEFAGLTLERNPFPTRVEPGTPRTVALRLVEAGAEGADSDTPAPSTRGRGDGIAWNTAPQLIVSGLRFGLVLALAAIGLSLVFGTTGLTNFAHGELVTFGALITYALHVIAGLPLLIAAPVMLLLAAAFGWLQDTAIWSQLRKRGIGLIAMMIFSIGFSFFLRYGFLYFFGGQTVFYQDFSGQAGIAVGPVRIRPLDVVSMVLSVVVLLAVAFALLYTRIGKATRAVSDNPALASASGIDVDRVIRVVWIAGTFLAALSGMLLGLSQGMDWLLGFQILLLIFAAVVLGGLGTAFGAIVGAITVGLLIEVSTLVIPPELKNVGALAVLIIILLVRPQGLLGRPERIG